VCVCVCVCGCVYLRVTVTHAFVWNSRYTKKCCGQVVRSCVEGLSFRTSCIQCGYFSVGSVSQVSGIHKI
jgi:hypothetical protein